MKIVIDIDEDVYTKLFDNGIQDNEIAIDDICKMARSLRLGTPLPKGHGRLKDVDDLYENTEICHSDIDGYACVSWKDINDAPTIIEADAPKRGKGTPLEENDSGYNCENWIP